MASGGPVCVKLLNQKEVASGGGVVDWYILVEGGVKVWSMPVECTIHYSIY